MRRPVLALIPAFVLMVAISFPDLSFGQNSDFNLDVHANSHATAKDIGLPEYPGATPFKDKDSDSSSADLSFLLNTFHIGVKAATFVTPDPPARVLEFYRQPLMQFGEVLECNQGKPVGGLTRTKSGLTCGNPKNGVTVNESDSGHELRAGKPEQFWIVGIDPAVNGKTKFGLVALVLPKDGDKK
jgi:hypothetical protein